MPILRFYTVVNVSVIVYNANSKVFATGWWFSPGSLVSSTNKTDHYDITEMLLELALNTITLTLATV
jgi:hypothetical protein